MPELIWRLFRPVTKFDPMRYGIQLLKKIEVPPPLKLEAEPAP